jgi:hypothetical protein
MKAGFTALVGWMQGLVDKGDEQIDEEHLCEAASVSINQYLHARDRWDRLEIIDPRAAPIWLSETEQAALLKAIRGQKGAELRLLRQAIQEVL